MSSYVSVDTLQLVNLKKICQILCTFFLVIFLGQLVKFYLSRRHLVKYANKLPQLKLRIYNILGHISIVLNKRFQKLPNNLSPHVYDFLSWNGYNVLLANTNVVGLWQLHRAIAGVTRAESVEVILNNSTELKKAWFYDFLYPWLGTGLLTSHDEKWKAMRKLLTPAFHFNILKDFLLVFNKQSKILVEVLKRYTKDEYVDIVPVVTRCSLDIMCESILGTCMHSQTQSFSPYCKSVLSLADLIFERLFRPWIWPDFLFNISPSGKLHNNNVKVVQDFTNKLIAEKKKEKLMKKVDKDKEVDEFQRKKRALLDLLLEEHIDNGSISEAEIMEQVNTFAFEGHDTTAMAMSWSLYLIGLHPWIQEKVHYELDSIFGKDDREATAEDLKEMKYLECVIKEALRLYPSVPEFGRIIREDMEINGFLIPKGCNVVVDTFILHRDPEMFPNPEKFDPDRFTPENSAGRHPFAYVPFSAGPRNCIGQRFALMEEKAVISSILRRYKIRSLDPRDRIHVISELILRPANGLKIQIRERNQEFDFDSVYYRP